MKTTMRPAVATAVIATICGLVLGWIVIQLTGHSLHPYLRFVGVLIVVAIAVVGTWVYRTYVQPKGAHVEETKADATS